MRMKILITLCCSLFAITLFAGKKSPFELSITEAITTDSLPGGSPWRAGASSLIFTTTLNKGFRFLVIGGNLKVDWLENESSLYFGFQDIFIHNSSKNSKVKKFYPIGMIDSRGQLRRIIDACFEKDKKKGKVQEYKLKRLVFAIPEETQKCILQLHNKKITLSATKGKLENPFTAFGQFSAQVDNMKINRVRSGSRRDGFIINLFGKALAGYLTKIDTTITPQKEFMIKVSDFVLTTDDGDVLPAVGTIFSNKPSRFDGSHGFSFKAHNGAFKAKTISLIFNVSRKTRKGTLYWLGNKIATLSFTNTPGFVGNTPQRTVKQKEEPFLYYTQILKPCENFNVSSEETRVIKREIKLPSFANEFAYLKMGVFHAADDTGDRGMTYKIVNEKGDAVKEGFVSSKTWYWIAHKVRSGENYTFELYDKDTKLSGKHPGNGGALEIRLAKDEF